MRRGGIIGGALFGVVVLVATGSSPAGAAEPADVETLRACRVDGAAACVGIVADACRETTEGGETTLGIVDCARRETAAWDVLLNEEYRATMALARNADAVEAEHFPEFAVFAEALRDAQRAWIAFRDAECGLASAAWGSGSMRHIATANCLLEMTAARTSELRAMRETY